MMPALSGKAAIEDAKCVAKAHGVEIAAWNDKVGKEFASLTGSGDKLLAFQNEMKARGWYIWPQEPAMEGVMLDVALYPPPPDAGTTSDSGIVVDDEDTMAMPAGRDFHYTGLSPATVFWNAICWSAIPVIVVWGKWTTSFGWSSSAKALASSALIAAAAIIVAFFQWMVVDADRTRLVFRVGISGKGREIAMGEIKKANIFRDRDRNLGSTRYLGINLKSGEVLDLRLPRRRQKELVALIRASIHPESKIT
jgi:hypothetical protein